MSYLWGLDLSLSNTGIAIVSLNTYKPILITSVKTTKNKKLNTYDDHKERLKIITDKFDELIKEFPVGVVAIEAPFVQYNNSTKATMKVHGVTQRYFYNYPQYFYAPTTVKATITGNGAAGKEVVQNYLEKKYPNINFANDNESDALAIAITYLLKNKKINMVT